jgi:hypothetical protein
MRKTSVNKHYKNRDKVGFHFHVIKCRRNWKIHNQQSLPPSIPQQYSHSITKDNLLYSVLFHPISPNNREKIILLNVVKISRKISLESKMFPFKTTESKLRTRQNYRTF